MCAALDGWLVKDMTAHSRSRVSRLEIVSTVSAEAGRGERGWFFSRILGQTIAWRKVRMAACSRWLIKLLGSFAAKPLFTLSHHLPSWRRLGGVVIRRTRPLSKNSGED